MNIARLSNLKPVFISFALAFTFITQLHGQVWDPPFQQQYENEHEFLAACRQNRLDIVEHWLSKEDFNPDEEFPAFTGKKASGLLVAAQNGHTDIVRALLNNGANPNFSPTNTGCIPLVQASWWGRTETVQLLLTHNADPNLIESRAGLSALMAAISNGNSDIAEILLKKEANPNITSDHKAPPIFAAIVHGQTYMVKLLLKYGADPNLLTKGGSSPLSIACLNGAVLAANTLIEKGADVHFIDNNGFTPLYIAASSGHPYLVKTLLDKGVNRNLGIPYCLCFKDTPLRAAKRYRLFSLLLGSGKYQQYTTTIKYLSEQKPPVPLLDQRLSDVESSYDTPENNVVDDDMPSESTAPAGVIHRTTFRKDAL